METNTTGTTQYRVRPSRSKRVLYCGGSLTEARHAALNFELSEHPRHLPIVEERYAGARSFNRIR